MMKMTSTLASVTLAADTPQADCLHINDTGDHAHEIQYKFKRYISKKSI